MKIPSNQRENSYLRFGLWSQESIAFNNPLKGNKDSHTTCLLYKWSNAMVVRPDDTSLNKYDRDHSGVSKEEYDLDMYPTYC